MAQFEDIEKALRNVFIEYPLTYGHIQTVQNKEGNKGYTFDTGKFEMILYICIYSRHGQA